MALTKTKDPIDVAIAKAASATNLFAVARAHLQQSTDLLEDSVAADQAAIGQLQARVVAANAQKAANESVAAKLEEFIP